GWPASVPRPPASAAHGLSSALHAVPLGSFASVGHAVFVPSQTSATSHSPTAGRHTALALPAGCWQVSLVPSQVSVVHGLPSSVHAVALGRFASVGHAVFVPSQTSATSQAPAAARHSVLAFPAGPPWHCPPLQASLTVHGLPSSHGLVLSV